MDLSSADRSKGVAYLAQLRRGKPASVTDLDLVTAEAHFLNALRALRARQKRAGESTASADDILVFRGEQYRCAVAVLAERSTTAHHGRKELGARAKSSAEAWGKN